MATTNTTQSSTHVGTNLNGVTYYSAQLPFVDLFKTSSPWLTQNSKTWNTKEFSELNLDASGWVKSLPRSGSATANYTQVATLINRDIGRYPGGRYVVLYDGEGTINYGFDAKRNAALSKPGRDVLDVTPSSAGIYLSITATDTKRTGNYIRNIRLVPQAFESTYKSQPFNPEFLKKIDDFSTLRFMDWMRTNGSSQGSWSNRPTVNDATYASGKGVPIETMIDLANRLGKNPWFNIPHQASDEYITNFAKLVKQKLNPNLKAYVEYSNEVWNSMFEQHNWVKTQAAKSGIQWQDWFGRRTEQIGDMWDKVLGNNRVVTVLAGQSANPGVAQEQLKGAKKYDQNLTIDSIAIAPYFGHYLGAPSNQTAVQQWTKDSDGGLNKLFKEMSQGGVLKNGPAGGALQRAYEGIKGNAKLANQEKLDLIAYEGGQHLAGFQGVENNQAITDLFIKANRDPRMGTLYRDYLTQWKKLGGGLFTNFSDIGTPSKWGSWGTLEYVSQTNSPKYDALLNFIKQNPPAATKPGGTAPSPAPSPTPSPAPSNDLILTGGKRNDSLVGKNGKDRLSGLENNDILVGNGGNDILSGGSGNDKLYGGSGTDTLYGGADADTLYGGLDTDTLYGGTGRDVFALETGIGRDLIKDFTVGQDKLGLTNGVTFKQLSITRQGNDALISFGNDQLAQLQRVRASSLTAASFAAI